MEGRPAILVHRGAFSYGVTSVDLRTELDLLTGGKKETDLLSGTFRVHCVARNDAVAERMAVWVARCVRHFRDMLRQAGFFQIGRQIQIGEVSDAGGLVNGAEGSADRTWVQVPVFLPVYYQEIVSIAPTAAGTKNLSAVEFTLHGRGVRVDNDNSSLLPYYPLEVDGDGVPSGPHVVDVPPEPVE